MHKAPRNSEVVMSDPYGSPTIPAAWYPDPADAHQLRYWNGAGWTNQTAQRPAAAPPAVPPPPVAPPRPQPTPAPALAPAVESQPAAPFQPAAPYQPAVAYQPAVPSLGGLFDEPAAPPYVPLAFTDNSEPIGAADAGWSPNTISGWLYAFVPVLLAALALMPLPVNLLNASDLPARVGLVLLFIALAIALAAIDGMQLRHRDFVRVPPPVLGVIPPVYSIARAAAVGRRGFSVAAVSLAVQTAVTLGLLVHFLPVGIEANEVETPSDVASSVGFVPPFTEAQKAALLTPEGMAAKIMFDAAGSALRYKTVTCDPIPSTELGVQVMCTAQGTIADYDIYVQLIPTSDGVPFTVTSVAPSLKL